MNLCTQGTYTLHLPLLLLPYTYRGPRGFTSFNPGVPSPTILLTLGNVTEELELHWHTDHVVEEWEVDASHAVFMLFIKPAVAAEYGLIYYIYSKRRQKCLGFPCFDLEPGPKVCPPLPCSGILLTDAA